MARFSQKFHAKSFKSLSKVLQNKELIQYYSFSGKDFIRDRKLPFQTVVLLILGLLRSSIKTELKSFHENVFNVDEVVNWVTDSAFCKARQKIKYQLFKDLNDFMVEVIYSHINIKRWHSFRLLAVDGSELNLPSSKELLDKFGSHHTNSIGTQIPQARVSFLCDILNHVTIDAQMEPFKVSEQEMLNDHLCVVGKNDLLTADANYGHFHILKLITSEHADFCIRMNHSSNFIKAFLASNEDDAVLEWNPSVKTMETCKKNNVDCTAFKVRLVRIKISEKETEVLALSLLDQDQYRYEEIKELYNKRWTIEEEIKKVMQRLMIEFFSSLKENGVRQDFYAQRLMLNLVSFMAEPVIEQIAESSTDCKYQQQINWTSALRDVRQKLPLLFLRTVTKIHSIIKSFWKSFKINVEAIKPDRKFPRDKRKKGSRRKAFINYKPAW